MFQPESQHASSLTFLFCFVSPHPLWAPVCAVGGPYEAVMRQTDLSALYRAPAFYPPYVRHPLDRGPTTVRLTAPIGVTPLKKTRI